MNDAVATGPTPARPLTTILFTDIEGSTRLWERDPEHMQGALAAHDRVAHGAVDTHRGRVVKTTGDGMYAVFPDPLDGLQAALALQCALADPASTGGLALKLRCGLHVGAVEQRGDDYFGGPVNRAARIMAAGYGGQVLLSQPVRDLVRDRLPPDTSLADLGLVRLRDLSSPEHLFQLVHPQLRREFPALRSLESTPNNLPQQLTSFVGRGHELEEVTRLFGDARLVTLQGAGGIGKTRLALQVAAEMLDAFPDGAWIVELAGTGDPRLVPQAVASVLGVKEEGGHTLQDALVDYARPRRLLLVLDNCEHLLEACATLARDLLRTAPALRVLATSRERLHINGETVYQVQPLAFPADEASPNPAALLQCDAVRLFAERAVAAQSTFAITPENGRAIATICRRLDGIPLALELAAARVRSLSPQQIATRLADRFKLLTTGDRTALPRQQTLRALIDWSYDLLGAPERALLTRLGVFAGGWTLEAAEAVTPDDTLAEADVLDLLAALVEKSLVVTSAGGERYHLLETVQRYALDRLRESGDEAKLRARHLAHYLAFAETARPELIGPEQAKWFARLDAERQNLLAAHAWCDTDPNGGVLGLRLVTATRRYWILRGLLGVGHSVAVEALARPSAQDKSIHRCWALFDLGQIGSWMGRYAEAQRNLEECIALARELGDKRAVAVSLQPLAMACMGQGDTAAARPYLDEALSLAHELGDQREIAGALNALAQLHRQQNELTLAEPLLREVVVIGRGLHDPQILAIGLLNLAMVLVGRGMLDDARAMLLEALQLARETLSKPTGVSALEVCAGLAALCRAPRQAAWFYGAAGMQEGETGLRRDPADERFFAPLIESCRRDLDAAAFASAEAEGRRVPYEDALGEAERWLRAPPPRGQVTSA